MHNNDLWQKRKEGKKEEKKRKRGNCNIDVRGACTEVIQ